MVHPRRSRLGLIEGITSEPEWSTPVNQTHPRRSRLGLIEGSLNT